MSARTTVDEFIAKQGWDDDTVIVLLCDFIDSGRLSLYSFLEERSNAS